MNPPIIAARLKDTHRLIPSRYPPTGILDLITAPEDFEAVAELEGWTNDRISAELGVLSILPAQEWVLGRANPTVIMAAYCHPNESGGRFTSAERGAWYAGLSIETAIRRPYFTDQEIAESGILETTVQMRQYLADFETEFHDVRASLSSTPVTIPTAMSQANSSVPRFWRVDRMACGIAASAIPG